MSTNKESPVGSRALKQTELSSARKVTFPAGTASEFSPDILAVAAIVQRARQFERIPPATIILADGREVLL